MLRPCVLLSLIIVISAFTPHMCNPLPTVGGRKIVPIVCKPRLKLRDMPVQKLVYEATFENDRIVIRPHLIKSANFGHWIQDHKHVIEDLNI